MAVWGTEGGHHVEYAFDHSLPETLSDLTL